MHLPEDILILFVKYSTNINILLVNKKFYSLKKYYYTDEKLRNVFTDNRDYNFYFVNKDKVLLDIHSTNTHDSISFTKERCWLCEDKFKLRNISIKHSFSNVELNIKDVLRVIDTLEFDNLELNVPSLNLNDVFDIFLNKLRNNTKISILNYKEFTTHQQLTIFNTIKNLTNFSLKMHSFTFTSYDVINLTFHITSLDEHCDYIISEKMYHFFKNNIYAEYYGNIHRILDDFLDWKNDPYF